MAKPKEDIFITMHGNTRTRQVWFNRSTKGIPQVKIEPAYELHPKKSQAVYNHSPDGFSWGYYGSGCAQLALAVLLELTDKETAVQNYQRFKQDVIACLDTHNDFLLELRIPKKWWN